MREHLASTKVRPGRVAGAGARSSTTSTWSSRSTGSASVGCSDRCCSAAATARSPNTSDDRCGGTLPAYDVITDLERDPAEPAGAARRQSGQPAARRRRADRAAAARPRREPDVVGLGRPGPHPAHPGAHRRPRRRRHDLAARRRTAPTSPHRQSGPKLFGRHMRTCGRVTAPNPDGSATVTPTAVVGLPHRWVVR